ncbi:MAG TPA: helix-hairpin-helix domain-containing protein, partial [Candidatus Saccharimonadales bacterium]|nr:helix-hairpin-helix domain-containing protein [Candidatus Saccharimonadales bacterium]
ETIKRRLSEKNLNQWGKPNLVLIDGGKGQLDAALKARATSGQTMPFIGLAKREEQIVIKKSTDDSPGSSVQSPASNVYLNYDVLKKLGGYTTESEDFILVNLPHSTNLIKLLQRIRDESHRFAVSYHSSLKTKRQTSSRLEDVPGIGPVTRRQLIKKFGSLRGVTAASQAELAEVVGRAKAVIIKQSLDIDK